ncbi:regulatory protein, luxR family [Pustulibacterium marinum]|uniref:Regulatory protein, luxR family n=1 Tax=Pustulibacterium marinum TaxID=1224947 RepID=A0A1I7F2I2_9FLAO|nr:triple tyrosine motif-containing protein [Pustulibacterium marinum]SFU30367.1 regulatory protein, luxR family [Pustulibacterium marinum]
MSYFKNIFSFFLILIVFAQFSVWSQELPPIVTYETDAYKAGNQNWMIAQDDHQFIYAANHSGLLEFNGSEWKLHTTPNETTVRSVRVVDNKVYTGCYMDFGFWDREENGTLEYSSLSDRVPDLVLDDEQFWNIISYDNWVIFQSLDQLFLYDLKTENIEVIHPEGGILKVFNIGASVYFQTINKGLFEIVNGNPILISDADVLRRAKIVNLYPNKNGYIIHTQLEGLFQLSEQKLTPIPLNIPPKNIYNSIELSNGNFALGTVSDGIYIINSEGETQLHINQVNGLSNNTVLALFEDANKNLWVGLDNGINCINLTSSVESYIDDTGRLGTIYASALVDNMLYLGTNQGLFYKHFNKSESFQFINNTKGQVWDLKVINGTLFCGHDSGTFIVNDDVADRIFSESGTWTFTAVPNQPTILLQGNYYGISVLEKVGATWKFRNKLDGFQYSSRFLEILDETLFVSHEYKGVFKIHPNKDFENIKDFEILEKPVKTKNASITKFQNTILYASKEGVFKWNLQETTFQKDSLLTNVVLQDGYTSGRLIVDDSDKLWLFTQNHINYFTHSNFDAKLRHHSIPIPYVLANAMSGYENITYINGIEAKYLIGTVNGYYLFDPEDQPHRDYQIHFTEISAYRRNDTISSLSFSASEEFNYKENNFNFAYSIPQFSKYANAEYQYKLEGFNDEWSSYSSAPNSTFKSLAPGVYTFKVRGKVGDSQTTNTLSYNFVIAKPWFATNIAIISYAILLLIIALIINQVYKNYYNKQKQKLIEDSQREIELHQLEAEKKLMKAKTEMLEKDIESKNRELAASTLNLIKKNEMLSAIKNDLKKLDSTKNVKSVITTINSNINEEDTWNKFSEAFNNADKDFLKKIKELHPSLTPNDLRLCAYLRLNLSSKEIAPLLNISVRSVEIKRYRLRKKMNLVHEQGLVDYILNI